MSPFMLADRIKKPILLIHGEDDNNSGTMTMQVHSSSHLMIVLIYFVDEEQGGRVGVLGF
jgi:predicted alpha/beta-fold hydrolase